MTKTRRVAKTRRVRGLPKKKLNSKRRGRGKVDELPFLIKTMLNNVNLKKNGAEFYEKGVVEKIVAHIPKQDVKTAIDKAQEAANKAEYERRIIAALALNEKILKTQEAEIKRLEMSGIDGPAQRTRSKARPTTNPVLEELRLDCLHLNMNSEKGVDVCTDCGEEITKQIHNTKEWRYYGQSDTRHSSDPNRVHLRKLEERNKSLIESSFFYKNSYELYLLQIHLIYS